jgi:DNA-directed RNA polymerase subunit D
MLGEVSHAKEGLEVEIKILDEDGNTLRFLLRGSSIPFANALRRIMLAEVPTMAIDDAVIIENTSVMYDEVLAHRLGLLPLVTDLDTYVMPEECSCKSELGCSKCRVVFTLEAEAKEEVKTVYSRDLVPDPSNPSIKVVSDDIPLVKLAPGQRIKLEAYARLGRGEMHAKWQPLSLCAYKFMPKISINRTNCGGQECGKCVEVCHKKVLSLKNGALKVENPMDCTLCGDCMKACPSGAINVGYDSSSFIYSLETLGGLPNKRIVLEAAKILAKKAESFREALSEILKEEAIGEGKAEEGKKGEAKDEAKEE